MVASVSKNVPILLLATNAIFCWPTKAAATEWRNIPLPQGVEYLTALECGHEYLYAAMKDSVGTHRGLFRTSLEAPGQWESLGLAGKPIYGIVAAGFDDAHVLIATSGTPPLLYSSDGGQHWTNRDAGIRHTGIRTLASSGPYPGHVYASGSDLEVGAGMYWSTDFGETWSYWQLCQPGCSTTGVLHFAVPDEDELQAWSVTYTGYWQSAPYRTTDGGRSWQSLHYFDDSYPVDLDVSARDSAEIFLLHEEAVIVFRNGVETGYFYPPFGYWANIADECPLWDPDAIYAAGVLGSGLLGVCRAVSPWQDWTSIRSGLPDQVSESPNQNWEKFHLVAGKHVPALFLATWGLGLWMRDMTDVAAVPGDRYLTQRCLPFPNPTTGSVWMRLDASQGVQSVDIFDASGRRIRTLTTLNGGGLYWDGCDHGGQEVKTGCYYVRLQGPGVERGMPHITVIR